MVDSTCPYCGSPEVYNSGFRIECPTKGCANFSEAQAKAVGSISYSFQPDDYVLERGKRYYITCTRGTADCASGVYTTQGQSESRFSLKVGDQYLLRMEEDEDYQACVKIIAQEDDTRIVLQPVVDDTNSLPDAKDLLIKHTLKKGDSFDMATM